MLLDIVKGACLRCGISTPVIAFQNPDPTIQQFVAFAQDAGDELAERWTWRALNKPHVSAPATIVGDGVTTLFPMPADWGRLSPSDTLTSSVYPTLTLRGPMNDEDLLRMKALPFVPLPSVWRMISDPAGAPQIEFFPAPALNEVISYIYGSMTWILDADQNLQPVWTGDDNTTLIAERLIRLGTIWRWKKSKGLDYGEEFRMSEMSFDRRAGQESTLREIRMSRYPIIGAPWWPGTIIDDTSWINDGHAE